MEWLNYHHLYYFSIIAEEGGVAPAARRLRLTHSTLSAQLRALEAHFGTPLFDRRGRRLVLTAFGVDALAYATDIFRLGRALNDVARGRGSGAWSALRVGVVPGMPKSLVARLLAPALSGDDRAVALSQAAPSELMASLAAGRLHLVLANDTPVAPPGARLHVHPLGETDLLLYGRRALATRARRRFPSALAEVPLVLPPPGAPLRRRLDAWFAARGVSVRVKAEAEDAGLLRALGLEGQGVFPVRAALSAEVDDLPGLDRVGRCEGLREPYFAVTVERRVRHPALAALLAEARVGLGGRPPRTA